MSAGTILGLTAHPQLKGLTLVYNDGWEYENNKGRPLLEWFFWFLGGRVFVAGNPRCAAWGMGGVAGPATQKPPGIVVPRGPYFGADVGGRQAHMSSLCPYSAGSVIAFFWRVTAVCANSLPVTDVPVFTAIMVLPRTMPSKCALVPRVTEPATCQKIFLA